MADVRLTTDELERLAEILAPMVTAELRRTAAAAAPADTAPEFVGVHEAAKLACVTRATVYRWIAEGRLHRHGTDGRALIARAELATLLAGSRVRRRRR